jgi:TolB-like protein/class 3 adenylate cyclase
MVQERPVRVERRLSAILAADVAGYSRLMHHDEEATHAQLSALLAGGVEPAIEKRGGRIVKNTGDGFLAEFPSAVEAVRAAVQFQTRIDHLTIGDVEDRRIAFRVGVNIGDVIVEPHDIFGDGVNIAARLERIAEPGGICISSSVYDQVRGKVGVKFADLGEQNLKNIAQPVRVYGVRLNGAPARPALSLPDRPSIAVLPFINMSSDPEQEYFADGIVEEIITALSRLRWLFVIARNSSFAYKGHSVDVKQIGRELGVRYVLEGSVRKVASRVRITGQLIDTATGAHLWADRFDGGLENIFDLQDQVTASVVGAVAPKLEQAEIQRARRKPTESLDAYDYFLRGMANVHHWTREGISEALRLFYRAIELDPDFASAYGMAAWCYVRRKSDGWMTDFVQETAETARLARRADQLGKDDAVALCRAGFALAFVVGDIDTGADLIDRALVLNPNLAAAWYFSGRVRLLLDEPDMAIKHSARAMRLSPVDPLIFLMQYAAALAHFFAGRYEEASSWAEKAARENANFLPAVRIAAASNALAGRLMEAHKLMAHLREADPSLRISDLKNLNPFRRPEDFARWAGGLRKAGLPE